MKTPPYLSSGDKIGIIAPARSISMEEIQIATDLFKNKGFEVLFGKNLFGKDNQFSGSDKARAADIQEFLDDPSIKAIICGRGGYGSVRTLPLLNFDKFVHSPKWFVGYSDITVFHSVINNLGIESLHSPMVFNIGKNTFDKESVDATLQCLTGAITGYTFASHELNNQGKAKGRLIGGNLSVLYSLRGTKADLKTHGKILFIEDIDEYLYHIDRIMMNFKLGGLFDGLRAIIAGSMTDMKDNNIPFGKNAYEIVSEHTKDLGIPVCYGFPAGHGDKNWPLYLGKEIILEVANECKLTFIHSN